MSNVLIDPDINHLKAGQVGKLLTFDEIQGEIEGTITLDDDTSIVKFPDGSCLAFKRDEFTVIDLKPMPPAFDRWLTKNNLMKWLKSK